MTITTPQACELFEIDRSTLTRWKRVGADVAYVSRNKWDLKRLVVWWAENIYQGDTPDEAETLSAAKNRYWQAKAKREELRAEMEARELIDRKEVARQWALRVGEVTAGLSTLKDRLPPLLEGKERREMAQVIEDEVRTLRNAYVRRGDHCPTERA